MIAGLHCLQNNLLCIGRLRAAADIRSSGKHYLPAAVRDTSVIIAPLLFVPPRKTNILALFRPKAATFAQPLCDLERPWTYLIMKYTWRFILSLCYAPLSSPK